jgi:hypothetical protein
LGDSHSIAIRRRQRCSLSLDAILALYAIEFNALYLNSFIHNEVADRFVNNHTKGGRGEGWLVELVIVLRPAAVEPNAHLFHRGQAFANHLIHFL